MCDGSLSSVVRIILCDSLNGSNSNDSCMLTHSMLNGLQSCLHQLGSNTAIVFGANAKRPPRLCQKPPTWSQTSAVLLTSPLSLELLGQFPVKPWHNMLKYSISQRCLSEVVLRLYSSQLKPLALPSHCRSVNCLHFTSNTWKMAKANLEQGPWEGTSTETLRFQQESSDCVLDSREVSTGQYHLAFFSLS